MARQKQPKLRVDHGPIDDDIVDELTDAEKEWLRAWNRGDEIPDEDGDDTDADDTDEDEEDEEDEYDDMTNDQLREELGRRGLPKSGNQDELIARLREDDEDDDES